MGRSWYILPWQSSDCRAEQPNRHARGIGLVPDVGGSHILANAPGNLGAYLAYNARMSAADAIYIGFADAFIPEAKRWKKSLNRRRCWKLSAL